MTPEQQKYVAQKFVERAQSFQLKKGSKKYKDAQCEFFCGAMAAWCATIDADTTITDEQKKLFYGMAMPPKWVFGMMRGDDLVETTLSNQTAQS